MRNINRFVLLALLVSAFLPSWGQQIVDIDDAGGVRLGSRLQFFVDSSGQATPDNIQKQSFTLSSSEIFNLGNNPNNVWIRFSVRSAYTNELYLEIDAPLLEELELYQVDSDRLVKVFDGGFLKPFRERPLSSENFQFNLHIDQGAVETFYVKVHSGFPLLIPITVSSREYFIRQNQQHNLFWGFYMGIVLFAFLYNLFIYSSVREKTYLLYILYILGSSVFYLGLQGFSFKFFWPGIPFLNTLLPAVICLTNIIITRFSMRFLQIHKKQKGLFYFGWGSIFLYALFALINFFGAYPMAAGLAQLLSLVTCIYFIYAAIRRYRQGIRSAKYYLIGWTIFLILVMIYILTINGVLAGNFFTTHSIFIGHMTEVLLLSFALADRINLLKEENAQKQHQIIRQLEENEKLQLKVNRELEEKVLERTREVVEQKNEAEAQRARSEELLLNILPAETAEELKSTGSAQAKMINQVTVLFSDIQDFTSITESISPSTLVSEINECFSAFDRIMEKYGVEKIKTIGDAYMAAGGLPVPNHTHAFDVINAAFEIQDFMAKYGERKRAQGKRPFEIRIGIHSGPVVAGIVGIKKFAYDIWGDTVNLANRMESAGEVGKINISEATYQLVKDHFNCTYRGKLEAKHKGLLSMYFVERKS